MKFFKNKFFWMIVFLSISIILYNVLEISKYLNFENLKNQQQTLQNYKEENFLITSILYLLVYILSVALSFPGATILTLAGGTIFGLFTGTIFVSLASTIGASLNFLISRYFLKESLEKKFPDKLKEINKGIKEDGAFYLLSLRLVPIFPFFLVNLLMGLTEISFGIFFFVSQVGMLLATIIYVNAGTQLATLSSPKDIFSINILISFTLLGLLPILTKTILNYFKLNQYIRKYPKPKKFDFNLIAIGGGAAGLVTAYIAATVKSKVALIEKHKMGGDCLNTGCVPSKSLISIAKKVSLIKKAEQYGLTSAKIEFDFNVIMQKVQSVIQKIEPHDSVERYTKLGVDCFQGNAKILSPYLIEVNGKTLSTKNIVIASGAEPLIPNLKGLEKIQYLTSENLWDLNKLPKKLLIVGGGPIGCELAQAFSRLGSQVTIVEMTQNLLNKEDKKVSDLIRSVFQTEGIKILTNHQGQSIEIKNNSKFLECSFNNQNVSIEFDEILFALGRKARTKGFGLEDLGLELNQNGTLKVDDFLRTKYPNIYACGDVIPPFQFTHTASHQAWYASVNALFSPFKKFKVDYRVIPWVTYTDPEIARVGINERDAKEKNIPFEKHTYELDDLDRAIAENETKGYLEIITPLNKDQILGVTIVGFNAGEILAEFVLAMKHNIGLNKILGTIHAYPTMAEANKYIAGTWKKAHAPIGLLKYVEKFHTWRRN
jgi:dihydrolipoamide dehydrogenase